MGMAFSIYLELIRLSAALLVLFGHLLNLTPSIYKLLGSWHIEHDAVVIFFVLSGYVISYVTYQKENTLYIYTVNRMARIYSVAIPALILSVIIQLFMWHYYKISFWQFEFTQTHGSVIREIYRIIKTFTISVFFLNECWWNHIWAFWDDPYWSLCYEVWYYALFAVFYFMIGWRRFVGAAIIAMIVGIKIMILFPVWLMGVAVHQLHKHMSISQKYAWIIWLSTFILYFLMKHHFSINYAYQFIGKPLEQLLGNKGLGGSNGFAFDYVLALIIGANIFSFRYLSLKWLVAPRLSQFIRTGASYTFSLYLYQAPLTILLKPFAYDKFSHGIGIILYYLAILSSVVILGRFTEHKKLIVRDWIKLIFSKLNRIRACKPAIKYQEAS